MNQEVSALLQEADWGTIRRELLIYTTWRVRDYRWRRGGDGELAEGKTVEDVVQEVIVKALSGVRRWDPDRGELLAWLQAHSRSVIDALAKSASHRREVSVPEVESLDGAQSPDPLEIVLGKEAKMQIQQKVKTLFQAVDREPELREVLQTIMDGCEPWPRYIASELGISVADVDNRLKRLRRRASKLTRSGV